MERLGRSETSGFGAGGPLDSEDIIDDFEIVRQMKLFFFKLIFRLKS